MKTPRFWLHRSLTSTLLLPASWLYQAGAWLDCRFTRVHTVSVPVIAVGNVTAGGAGKTPTTLALIPVLRTLGFVPHILTRGYGGAALTAHRVTVGDDWRHVGDEALLLAAAAPTWVGSSRVASARAAIAAGATILLCDDALQHYALDADMRLLVIDGPYGLGNGALLPAGPLREPLTSAAARCHAALIIGADRKQLAEHLTLPVLHGALIAKHDTVQLAGQRWLAFAGIGRPEKFYETLRTLGAHLVATQDFADHHAYDDTDITALIARAETLGARLITTTKDAVKIPTAHRVSIAVLPVELHLDTPELLSELIVKILGLRQPS